MKFFKIVIIDSCGLTQPELETIGTYSRQPMDVYDDVPDSAEEISRRIGTADCVLVSWRSTITEAILRKATSLKYIGMCCSLYDKKAANVDIEAAEQLGITVKGVKDYGDEGTVEFIFSQVIALFKGYGKYKWREQTHELKGKSIGIIGLGTLGLMVAGTALHFGMEVFYYSRTPKPALAAEGIHYMPLETLVARCDIITTHLPKHTLLMTESIFAIKKADSIFINTSLGPTYDTAALLHWLKRDARSFAIFDLEGAGSNLDAFQHTDRIIVYPFSSGSTAEAKKRLSVKVLKNLEGYLKTFN